MQSGISDKTHRVLNIVLIGLLLILARVWYLSIVQHDVHVEKAKRPQRRSVIEKVERATIRDRFNIPLALNKIQYNAAVCYADIRQIPSIRSERTPEGKRVRVHARSNYIKELSRCLADLLQMDQQQIEDTIHGKASLFPHTPFVIKENLSEEEYYKLKALEMQWVGIRAEKEAERHYPLHKVGADVIGYVGAIGSQEYYRIADEIKGLQAYLNERESGEMPMLPKGFMNPLQVRDRLKALQEKAYAIDDFVGKVGVECSFDADLRGFAGKKTYEIDTKGNLLRELPGGRDPIPGQRVLLSISSELQEFAEQLLADNESLRETTLPDGSFDWSTPWIKGGAIVAMDPNSGEILALASYPRFDPNDFTPSRIRDPKNAKSAEISKWLEQEGYLGDLWSGRRPLERERYAVEHGGFYTEQQFLSLSRYLQVILPPQHPILTILHDKITLEEVLSLQQEIEQIVALADYAPLTTVLAALYPEHPSRSAPPQEELEKIWGCFAQNPEELLSTKKRIDPYLHPIPHNDDKLLLLDLCHLFLPKERFSHDLIAASGALPLFTYHPLTQTANRLRSELKRAFKEGFHAIDFQKWRETHFKEFLVGKRKMEKEEGKYARPYTEYLDQVEKEMFKAFWEEKEWEALLFFLTGSCHTLHSYASLLPTLQEESPPTQALRATILSLHVPLQLPFLKTMRSFEELTKPLQGKYRQLRRTHGVSLEKHLAAAFYPLEGYGYGRSQAFRQSTPQGSVFKLVIAYQGLSERLSHLKESLEELNPLTLIDDVKWHSKPGSGQQVLGTTLDGQPIRGFYKGGRLPKSSHSNIGKIDLIGAIEQSSNIYFSILSSEHVKDPFDLIEASKAFGFGKMGIELPGEISGILPDDIAHNKSGLYSFAIGQHSLIVTPLQTAVMLSTIANGGKVLKPTIVHLIAGQTQPYEDSTSLFGNGARSEDGLSLIGIDFPLFTAALTKFSQPYIWQHTPEIKRSLFFPDSVRAPLIEGMRRAVSGERGSARPSVIRTLQKNPEWKKHYLALKDRWIGKTGTAEILYKQSIDAESKAKIHNHIWFGGISFEERTPQKWDKPDLVVVVYLRLSKMGGKEAAPLAAAMIEKWHALQESTLK